MIICLDTPQLRPMLERRTKCMTCAAKPTCKPAEQWELLNDVTYLVDDQEITVKAGFCFDGASVPQAFRSLIGDKLDPRFVAAALLHDALYISHATTRAIADGYLLDLLKLAGVSWWKRNAMWSAVRIAGGAIYNDHDLDEILHFRRFIEGAA